MNALKKIFYREGAKSAKKINHVCNAVTDNLIRDSDWVFGVFCVPFGIEFIVGIAKGKGVIKDILYNPLNLVY